MIYYMILYLFKFLIHEADTSEFCLENQEAVILPYNMHIKSYVFIFHFNVKRNTINMPLYII